LLRNEGINENGEMQFTDVAMAMGADDISDAKGFVAADFDHDGDLDIVINNNPGDVARYTDLDLAPVTPTYLRNNVGSARNWLAVELVGGARPNEVEGWSNRGAVGATVTIETDDGLKQKRHVGIGSNYASQQASRLYFGLGEQESVKSLSVNWPSGHSQVFENVAVCQIIEISEKDHYVTKFPGPAKM
jgi:hypothetical protein